MRCHHPVRVPTSASQAATQTAEDRSSLCRTPEETQRKDSNRMARTSTKTVKMNLHQGREDEEMPAAMT